MILDVIDNLVEKGVGILSKLASDWIDDLGKEVFGENKSTSSTTTSARTIVEPAVGNQPVNQVNVNVVINGMRQGLIFVDDDGNDIININGYHITDMGQF